MTDPTWYSLLPALVTIVLAFTTRRVIPSLFAGIVTGSIALWMQTGDSSDLNFLRRFLLPKLGSEGYAQILLIYLWCLGGLMGIWEKTGGALHFARTVGGALARGPRSALVFGWLLGLVFHQGGTVSTVLAGTTVKPVTDKHRVAHEELAYVVDSTASPAATLLPFNAWPVYVAGLIAGTVPLLPEGTDEALTFFYTSIPFNFYGIFAILGTLLFALGVLPLFGPMKRARERARQTGALDAPGAKPMLLSPVEENASSYTPSLLDFCVPIGSLLAIAVLPMLIPLAFGADAQNWINEAFLFCVLSAMGLALARGMALGEVLDGFVSGCRSMTIGAIVLGLAVTLGFVSRELGTAQFLVEAVGSGIPAFVLPAGLMLLCMGIGFSTGTSWGTYAVVFPVAMPLAYQLHPDASFLAVCFGAVLGGAVFGDQCSPISDTTILSSMFSGCDLMDHVNTQLPLALIAAGIGGMTATALAIPITASTPVAGVTVEVVDASGRVLEDARVSIAVYRLGGEGGERELVPTGDWLAHCVEGSQEEDACVRWAAGWGQQEALLVRARVRREVASELELERCFVEGEVEERVAERVDGAEPVAVRLLLTGSMLTERCEARSS